MLNKFGCEFRDGRPDSAPKLRQGIGTSEGEQLVASVDGVFTMDWHGHASPVAADIEHQSLDLPEAWPSQAHLLLHQHMDFWRRYPKVWWISISWTRIHLVMTP